MGVIKRGILGGMSGKVANVVGGSWKGIAYLRSLPLSVANPQTTNQVAQRLRFSTLVAIAQNILGDFIKPVTDRFVQAQSGFNAFISRNIAHVSGSGVVTWSDVVMAVGNLFNPGVTSAVATFGPERTTVVWDGVTMGNNGLTTDLAYIAIYNEGADKWYVSSGLEPRADGTEIVNGTGATGEVRHLWLVFVAADGSRVSNSAYYLVTE